MLLPEPRMLPLQSKPSAGRGGRGGLAVTAVVLLFVNGTHHLDFESIEMGICEVNIEVVQESLRSEQQQRKMIME